MTASYQEDVISKHQPETITDMDGQLREVCAECAEPDTGNWGTCDVAYSEPWPCKASRRERLTVVK